MNTIIEILTMISAVILLLLRFLPQLGNILGV